MQGEHSNQSSFFSMIYRELIPADHLLCKLAAAVELSFISELVSDCYCPDNGRPSWDPLVLFKVVFLQFLYDLSDREIGAGPTAVSAEGLLCVDLPEEGKNGANQG